VALVGITTLKMSESFWKGLHIILLHLLPFLWIPYVINKESIKLFFGVIICYFIFMSYLQEDPVDVYRVLQEEEHKTYREYVIARFGI
jgi:hypothetical protein